MGKRVWGVRGVWLYPDGAGGNGLVFLEQVEPATAVRALLTALAYFASGPHGGREFQSITLTIEERPE